MIFQQSEHLKFSVRSLRLKGYKTEEAARKAIERSKMQGYVKKLGERTPIWSNVA